MGPAARFGIGRIDGPLGGGLAGGIMADVYGPPASGKTQLAYRACAGAAAAGQEVLFVDAKGEFRPERVLEMAAALRAPPAPAAQPDAPDAAPPDAAPPDAAPPDAVAAPDAALRAAHPDELLGRISVRRVTTTGEQMRAAGSMEGFGLVVIDGVTELFTSEYDAPRRRRPGARHWAGRHRRFAEYARALSRRASECGAAVIMTNTVRAAAATGRQVESLGEAVSLFAHARMRLEPCAGPRMRWTAGELATLGATSRFAFEITPAGIVERDPALAGRGGGPAGGGPGVGTLP